jgi:hypothetical protein
MEPLDNHTFLSDQKTPLDEEVRTPLTDTLLRLKEQALESNLLYVMDVEALMKLAALNLLQQQADRFDESAPELQAFYWPFKYHYNWLHEINKYFIHRDDQTRVWRLGAYLSKRGGNGC